MDYKKVIEDQPQGIEMNCYYKDHTQQGSGNFNSAQMLFGFQSQRTYCPYCKMEVMTLVKNRATTKTHLFAMCSHLCCCCLPYCISSCQSQHHSCPNCNAYFGAYNS